jgi:chaperonin GroEL
MQFEAGYLSPFFTTDPEGMTAALENVYILIHQGKISSRKKLLPTTRLPAVAGLQLQTGSKLRSLAKA